MKKRIILIENNEKGKLAALIENDIFVNFQFDNSHLSNEYPLETIFVCKIVRVLKSIDSYFVDLPNGKNGFLKSKQKYNLNDFVMVISNVFADENKAQPLSDKIFLKGKYIILTIGYEKIKFSKKLNSSKRKEIFEKISFLFEKDETLGVIIRSASENVDVEDVLNESRNLYKKINCFLKIKKESTSIISMGPSAKELIDREWMTKDTLVIDEKNSFDKFGIWEQLNLLKNDKVELSNGSWINIEKTKAFICIDVNSGSLSHNKASYLINESVIEEIFKQIDLRGLGGKIIIDFISTNKKQKVLIEKKIRTLLKNNFTFKIFGWTRMGNMELIKKRDKKSIDDFFLFDTKNIL